MPGPWEQYQGAVTEDRPPWEQYANTKAPPPAGPVRRGMAAIPVGGTAGAPVYSDQLPQPAPQAEPSFVDKARGAVEAGLNTVAGLIGGGAGLAYGALEGVGENVGARLGGAKPKLDIEQNALARARQFTPELPQALQTPTGQEYTQGVGEALATHGPSMIGVGPELGALGQAMGPTARALARPALAVAGEKAAALPVKAIAKATPELAPESAAIVRKAASFGIDLPPDALSKNKFVKLAGEAARNVPLSGAGGEANAAAFNSALARRIGAVGEDGAPAAKITPEVFDKAMTQSGETIGRITEANPIPLDAVQSTIDGLRAASKKRSGGVANAVEGYLKDLEAKADENSGMVPGGAMKEILGQLGRDARSATDGPVRNALGELHQDLTGDVAKVLGPEDAAALRAARQQYSAALTIAPLVRPSGDISPSAFNQAFRGGRAGKLRAARGTGGELGDLAEVAQYMREPTSSLTAERGLTYAALSGAGFVEPHTAAGAAVGANLYNRLGPAVMREKAGAVKAQPGAPRPTGGEPPASAAPAGGGGAPAPGGSLGAGARSETIPVGEATEVANPATTDPRLAEIEQLKAATQSKAARAVLDEHAKAVQKEIETRGDADALQAAAKATTDPELRAKLLAKAEKLQPPLPVGKATEGQPPLVSQEPTARIPAGEATEIAPEVIAPEEPIPVGEAAPLPSNRPAGEVVSNRPAAEPVSNVPRETQVPTSNLPKAEPNAQTPDYTHGALFKAAETAGIETRGRRPSEVRAAFEASWAKEHGLNPFEAQRAKAVARALAVDEKAVEQAAVQHERSPVAFDRAIDKILESENAPETKQAAGGSASTAPNASGGAPSASAGRGGNANGGAERANSGEGNSNSSGAAGATEATAEQPRANSPATTGARAQSGGPSGQAAGSALTIKQTSTGFEAYRGDKKVGYLKSNLTPEQSKRISESASVDYVEVPKDERGTGVGRALYDAWNKAHEGRIEISGKTEPSAWKVWKRNYPEKVDAFVKQEAARIKDGADPRLVIGNIKDPEVAQRVQEAAHESRGPAASAKWVEEGATPEQNLAFKVEREAKDLAHTVLEEIAGGDFGAEDYGGLPKVIADRAKESNVPTEDLRQALLKHLDALGMKKATLTKVQRAVSPVGFERGAKPKKGT